MIRSLPRVRMKWSSDSGSRFGDQAEVISRRFLYFSMSRMAVSHHGSAPWIMQRRNSGKRMQTRSR